MNQIDQVFSPFETKGDPRFLAIWNHNEPITASQFIDTFEAFAGNFSKRFPKHVTLPLVFVRNEESGNRLFYGCSQAQAEWLQGSFQKGFKDTSLEDAEKGNALRKCLVELWNNPQETQWVANATVLAVPANKLSARVTNFFNGNSHYLLNLIRSSFDRLNKSPQDTDYERWIFGVLHHLTIRREDSSNLVKLLSPLFPEKSSCSLLSNDPEFICPDSEPLRNCLLNAQALQ